MNTILFLASSIALSSITFGMQQDAAKNLLLQKYANHIKSTFKPTTTAFLESHPNAPESQILQRYIAEFVKNAMDYRDTRLPLNVIGREFDDAWDYTPTNPDRLDYILTGQEPDPDMLCCAEICASEWKTKLKEIEKRITSPKG